MKRIFFLLLLLLSVGLRATDNLPFRLPLSATETTLVIDQGFTASASYVPWATAPTIESMSLDARVSLHSDTSLVRIFLEDTQGNMYLLLESLPYLQDSRELSVQRYGEETVGLGGVQGKGLKVVVKGATVQLERLHFSSARPEGLHTAPQLQDRRRLQVQNKVAAINAYNKKHHLLWVAKPTEIGHLPLKERLQMMNLSESDHSYGFEYYGGGVFEIDFYCDTIFRPSDYYPKPTENSPYVKKFDWRNRHGRNWITPAKKQQANTCWAFATVSLLEAYLNCYYNELLDYDLSEQDLVTFSHLSRNKNEKNPIDKAYQDGGFMSTALDYIKANGIVEEECYPFYPIEPSKLNYEKCPLSKEKVKVTSYEQKYSNREDTIKKRLLYSPLAIGLPWYIPAKTDQPSVGHAVLLVGYHSIEKGDTIVINSINNRQNQLIVRTYEEAQRLGTIWTIKNSYGTDWGNNGYADITFRNLNGSPYLYSIIGKPVEEHYPDHRVAVRDEDNDGYYTWGIGPRPANLPERAQLLPDGDDTDPMIGGIDEFGHCEIFAPAYQDTLYIDDNTTFDGNTNLYRHVVIRNNATLTLYSYGFRCHPDVSITINDGCTLNMNNMYSYRPKIIARGSGQVNIVGAGIELRTNGNNYINLGQPLDTK